MGTGPSQVRKIIINIGNLWVFNLSLFLVTIACVEIYLNTLQAGGQEINFGYRWKNIIYSVFNNNISNQKKNKDNSSIIFFISSPTTKVLLTLTKLHFNE